MEFTRVERNIIQKQAEMINDKEHGYITPKEFSSLMESFKNAAVKKGYTAKRFLELWDVAEVEASRTRHGAKTFIWN